MKLSWIPPCAALAALSTALLCPARAESPPREADNEAKALQQQNGHWDRVHERGRKVHYTRTFDLSGLPSYKPAGSVSGKIRLWGLNYLTDGQLASYWEAGFKGYQPAVQIVYNTPTALVAVPGLITGLADIGASRQMTFDELLTFQRVFNHHPLEITIVSGSYNVPGWAPATGFYVHKDNPLTKISLEQVDGVFGAERDGAYEGVTWRTEYARGPEKNIRKWGQLGLTGEWADQPISVYGRALLLHEQHHIERAAFHGSVKWNEQLHESYRDMLAGLSKDRYGIAFGDVTLMTPQVRMLALAEKTSGPYVTMSLETIQDRSYPLAGEEYFYLNRKPGSPLEPRLKEYIRYVLSREGQHEVERDGKFLPMTAELVREQLKKLD